jgi:hypothetical protein
MSAVCSLFNSSFIHSSGSDGSLVNHEHSEGGDGEDFKLQHIFDELFEGFSQIVFLNKLILPLFRIGHSSQCGPLLQRGH